MNNNFDKETEAVSERYRTASAIIIAVLLVLMISAGILLMSILLPKNGFVTETDEFGNEQKYLYYYNEKKTGWNVVNGGLRYFEPSDGHMLTGIQTIDGNIYYFMPENGNVARNRTITLDDGRKFFFDKSGIGQEVTK